LLDELKILLGGDKMGNFKPTQEQENVLDAIQGYFEQKLGPAGYHKIFSIFLSAVAGSGKTSTIMLIAELIAMLENEFNTHIEWCSLSFNKVIAMKGNQEYQERGLREVAKTTNALGNGILYEAAKAGQCRKPGKLDTWKYSNIAKNYCKTHAGELPEVPKNSPYRENEKSLTSKIKTLVSAVRLTYCNPRSERDLMEIVAQYPDTGIDILSPYWSFIWQAVSAVIEQGIRDFKATGILDFDDQLFLPLALDVTAPIYDFIAIDESQDLNKVRTELVKRSIKPNGALFFVGDRKQAIQGFAFADTNSVDNIIRDTQAVEMPLTVCWRCDADIIRMAQAINPAIQARPGAPAGIVDVVSHDYINALKSGYYSADKTKRVDADMVVCRVTADLVKDCLRAIRAGIFAIVRGKDIGRGIIAILQEIAESELLSYDLDNLQECAESYTNKKRLILSKRKNAEDEIEKLNDQLDTIDALYTGYLMAAPAFPSVSDFKEFIDSKFEDAKDENEEGRRPVVFSTVHKAKGLETDTVYILSPEKMPHPMAMKNGLPWQIEQEYNILYVAVTRPKHALYFVGGVPAALVSTFSEIKNPASNAPELPEAIIVDADPAPTAPDPIEKTGAKPGRKALAKEQKAQQLGVRISPEIKAAFTDFVQELQESGDYEDIAPGKKVLSGADVIEAMMKSFPRFAEFLASREPDPETDGPDDPNGGGQPAPEPEEETEPEQPTENARVTLVDDPELFQVVQASDTQARALISQWSEELSGLNSEIKRR
jgi:DNA helicase-2/ATP-dependent DNA helicase PcrA